MTKYCKYHRNNGHITNECKALQDKIEELIRVGHLKRFVKRESHPNTRPISHRDSTNTRPTGTHQQHDDTTTTRKPTPISPPQTLPAYAALSTPYLADSLVGGSTSSARKKHLQRAQSVNSVF